MERWNGDISVLDEGEIEEHVEKDLFGETIDTLDVHTDRKSALGDSIRYSILYIVYQCRTISRMKLSEATGRDSNGLQHHLRELLNNNMIAEVPAPDEGDGRMSYYRITKIGAQEIEADINNITGKHPTTHTTRFSEVKEPATEAMKENISSDYMRKMKEKTQESGGDDVMPSVEDPPKEFAENTQAEEGTTILEGPSKTDAGETNAPS